MSSTARRHGKFGKVTKAGWREIISLNRRKRSLWTTDRLDGMFSPMADSCVEKLLGAATAVIAANGVPGLTLDAVAKHAGVSKGGLLHYFPTKNALLSTLINRHVDGWRTDVMRAYDEQPAGPGRFSRALIELCLSDEPAEGNEQNWCDAMHGSCRVVLTAVVQDPSLVQPIRDLYSDFAKMISEDGLPPGHADVVVAVVDAMWLYWICDINAIDSERLSRVRAVLTKLITPTRSERKPRSTKRSTPPARNKVASAKKTVA
jgi:AcrR family transcriptional regulator